MPATTLAVTTKAPPTYSDGKQEVPYKPVPLPPGTYSVDTKSSGTLGGYAIQATVNTPLSNGKSVPMSDYQVHPTETRNTFGCTGIQTNPIYGGSDGKWAQVSNSISKAGDVSLVITK